MSRKQFLRTAGVGAAGVAVATYGLGGIARAELPGQPCGQPEVWTLWAGQNINAGTVTVWNDATNLYVQYTVTGDWFLCETHLWVGTDLAQMPTASQGQPIPGHFPHKEEHDPCVKTYTYTVPLAELSDEECDYQLYVVPHAAIKRTIEDCEEESVVYGIERYTGKVYSVDVLNGTTQFAFQIPSPPAPGSARPNGLAYNAANGFWYYTDYVTTQNDTLYFWDGTMQHTAGTLTGAIACGDIDESTGKYYYIPHNTDDLHEVTLGPDGLVVSDVKLVDLATDPTGLNAHRWSFNGDIAAKDGVIYGWGRCEKEGKYEFFIYDIATNTFSLYTPTYQASLQLAFGSDGTLFGHRSGIEPDGTPTGCNGGWYEVDTTNGAVAGPISCPGVQFTDAASGGQCVPEYQEETAFGGDQPGTGPRWWYYLIYTVKCCDVPPEACYEDETAWAANGDAPGEIPYNPTDSGNWATYVQYDGDMKTVTLYAGQDMPAGTVTFYPPLDTGEVIITIVLEPNWVFNSDMYMGSPTGVETVKVQGYVNAPVGNPSPGLFPYKGGAMKDMQSFTIIVPLYDPTNNAAYHFYGVHVDVAYEVPCP